MKPLKGWMMPEDDARSMLQMIDKAASEAEEGQSQRKATLMRFRALLKVDLEALAGQQRQSAA